MGTFSKYYCDFYHGKLETMRLGFLFERIIISFLLYQNPLNPPINFDNTKKIALWEDSLNSKHMNKMLLTPSWMRGSKRIEEKR